MLALLRLCFFCVGEEGMGSSLGKFGYAAAPVV